MINYIIRRLLLTIPTIIGIITITFLLMYVVPGDPVRILMGQRGDPETIAMIRKQMGLDDPLPVQYFRFLGNILRGDFGRSYATNRPVLPEILSRFPATLKLALASMLVASIIGLTAGIVSATKQYSFFDYSSMVVALMGVSAPVFWVGLLLMWIFGYTLGWLPISGYGGVSYLILPAIALGVRPAAYIARMTRSSFLEVLRQDYIRTARAKGLPERRVIYVHAMRNTLITVITVLGMELASLLSGAVLTETIFAWPGIGRLSVDAIIKRDHPMVQGTVLFTAIIFIFANLIVDISYAFLDPRIRYE
ncbi:MAG TPA: ABC transporter permease [bacterium]|jgi:peptide/nickel transport system permease protein|nr:ABC transporter permease [Dictyoglomota bacterium]HOP55502.1 ABC transporter permease [bacterium]